MDDVQTHQKLQGFEFSKEYREVMDVASVHSEMLYHYTSPEGLLGILNNANNPKLWFTEYDSLNDKSEGKNICEAIQEYINGKLRLGEIENDFAEKVCQLIPSRKSYFTTKGGPVTLERLGEISGYTKFDICQCQTYLC